MAKTELESRREKAETKGHDFHDWKNRPVNTCNFCHTVLSSSGALEQCDISERLEKAKNDKTCVIGKFKRK